MFLKALALVVLCACVPVAHSQGLSCVPLSIDQAEQCQYVRENDDCRTLMGGANDGLAYYGAFLFCDMNELKPLAIIILIVEILLLFVCLSEVAESYFAPIMGGVADELGLSHNVAGVTFLAFANGAPDIFSSFAAITTGKEDLGIASLFGGVVFIPFIVMGLINIVADGDKLTRRPLLRDLLFLSGIGWLIYAFFLSGEINLVGSISSIAYYIIYVLTVLISQAIYKRMKARRFPPALKSLQDGKYGSMSDGMATPFLPNGHGHGKTVDPIEEGTEGSRSSRNSSIASEEVERVDAATRSQHSMPSRPRTPGGGRRPQLDLSDDELEEDNTLMEDDDDEDDMDVIVEDVTSSSSQSGKSSPSSSGEDDNARLTVHVDEVASPATDGDAHHPQQQSTHSPRQAGLLSSHPSSPPAHPSRKTHDQELHNVLEMDSDLRSAAAPRAGDEQAGHPYVQGYAALGNAPADKFDRSINRSERSYSRRSSGYTIQDHLSTLSATSITPSVYRNSMIRKTTMDIMSEAAHQMDDPSAKETSLFSKIRFWLSRPMYYAARSTIPMATDKMWDWRLSVFCTMSGPVLFMASFDLLSFDGLPVGAIVIAPFILLACFFFKSLLKDGGLHPRFKGFFLFLGAIVAVAWMQLLATEVVNALSTLGVAFDLSLSILGITILAWGNCVADVVANMTVAKMGYPKMAVGAAIGGPLFNLSIGMGLAMTINNATGDGPFPLPSSGHITLSVAFSTATCILHVFAFWYLKFRLNRRYGWVLIVSYLLFVILNILVYAEAIDVAY